MDEKRLIQCSRCGNKFAPTVGNIVGFTTIKLVSTERDWMRGHLGEGMKLCPTCLKIMRECFLGYEVEERNVTISLKLNQRLHETTHELTYTDTFSKTTKHRRQKNNE